MMILIIFFLNGLVGFTKHLGESFRLPGDFDQHNALVWGYGLNLWKPALINTNVVYCLNFFHIWHISAQLVKFCTLSYQDRKPLALSSVSLSCPKCLHCLCTTVAYFFLLTCTILESLVLFYFAHMDYFVTVCLSVVCSTLGQGNVIAIAI